MFMRKTYYPNWKGPLVVFIVMLAYTVLTSPPTHMTRRWFASQVFLIVPTGILCLVYMFAQALTVDGESIVRTRFLLRRKRFNITDVRVGKS